MVCRVLVVGRKWAKYIDLTPRARLQAASYADPLLTLRGGGGAGSPARKCKSRKSSVDILSLRR